MSVCRVTGKYRYAAPSVALGKAVDLLARGHDAGHRPLNVYRCRVCHEWHIGHRPKVFTTRPSAPTTTPTETARERCAMHCKKPASEIVRTPNGLFAVCTHHAARLTATYTTAEGRRTL